MQIAACQYDILWENRQGNFDKVRKFLGQQDIAPGALIALPEMFSSGFSMNVEKVAESDPSESEAFMKELAQTYDAWVVGGLVFQQECGRGRNELAVISPSGQVVGRYQKNHTFSYTGESDFYDRGDDLLVIDMGELRVCPLICYDLRFPELFRRGVQQGANCFVVMASWPSKREDHWVTLLKARAIENQAFVIGVNRCGEDPKFQYSGRSMLIDHQGQVLADAEGKETCIVQEASIESLIAWRSDFPALRDMRLPDARNDGQKAGCE